MTKALALVTGDWHIRKVDRTWYRRDTLSGDTKFGIDQVCRLAQQHDVPNVLMLGDLFDQKLQMSTALRYMRDALDTFSVQNRRVLYVQGQHEMSSPPLLEAIHPWPVHIHRKMLELVPDGPCIYGLDYMRPADVEGELRKVDTQILATHQVWKDFMGADRGDAWMHWANAEYIFTGDFHQTLWEQRGKPWIMSPGPLCMQSIGEPPDKYVFILNDDMTATRVRLHARGYFENRIHDEQQLERFLDTWTQHPARMPQAGVPYQISTNLLRVYYREDVPDARARIEARVGLDAHLFLKSIPVEDSAITMEAEARIQAVISGGLEGCIRKFYADNTDVCNDAIRLARTQDISEELFNIFQERIHGSDGNGKGTLQKAH